MINFPTFLHIAVKLSSEKEFIAGRQEQIQEHPGFTFLEWISASVSFLEDFTALCRQFLFLKTKSIEEFGCSCVCRL